MTTQTQKLNFAITIPFGVDSSGRQTQLAAYAATFKNDNSPSQALSSASVAQISIPLNTSELESIKTFVEVLTQKAPEIAEAPLLTSGATSTEDEIANISYFVRTLMPEAPSTQAVGVTTGENVFQGFWAAIKAAERFVKARNLKDRGGMIEGGADAVRGLCQSVGGFTYLGYRGVMIPADLHKVDTSIKAVTPLGQSAYLLGMVGNIAFLIFYLMIGVWASYSLVEDFLFSTGMKAHGNNQLFDFFMQKVTADPKIKLQKFKTHLEKLPVENRAVQVSAFKGRLADIALSKFASHFLKWQDELAKTGELTEKPLTEQQVKIVFKTLFALKEVELRKQRVHAAYLTALGLDDHDLEGFDFTTLELIGFKLEQIRSQAKKEAKFSRATSDGCTEAVKKAAKRGLSERLKYEGDVIVKEAAQKELTELKGKVVSENTKNQSIHSALIAIAVLGIISTIMIFVTLNPVGVIAMTVIALLLVAGMMATDGYAMLEGWKSGNVPGRYDKTYLVVISLVIIAALAVSIGVTLGFGLPLLPMILACGIGGASLGLSSIAYYKLTQKEKAWIEDHPDLQRFKELLDSVAQEGEIDEKVTALFKKLSKEDRLAIRKKYSELSSNGQCGFKQEKYQKLDRLNDFGYSYLWTTKFEDDKEYQLFVRAMKKSVKFFWDEWAKTKKTSDCERALKLQSVLERVKQKKEFRLLDNMVLDGKLLDDDLLNKLKNDLWYVVKRQESLADLKHIVEAVIEDKTQAVSILPIQEGARNKVTPLIQRVYNVFHHKSDAA
jgi:uncharacterized membrane-anchored protein